MHKTPAGLSSDSFLSHPRGKIQDVIKLHVKTMYVKPPFNFYIYTWTPSKSIQRLFFLITGIQHLLPLSELGMKACLSEISFPDHKTLLKKQEEIIQQGIGKAQNHTEWH